jgi:hypothetical protein
VRGDGSAPPLPGALPYHRAVKLGDAERYPLADGHATFRREVGYLRVEEHGNPADADEMARYFAAIERALGRTRLRSLLIVAQRTGRDPASPHWAAIREARWRALAASRADRIAVIVDDELGVTRVQMGAVVAKAPVRGFVAVQDAVAWLTSERPAKAR